MLTEIKNKLLAYEGRELQHFIHMLNYFESVGADLITARTAAQEVLNDMVATAYGTNRVRGRNRSMPNPPRITCNVCGSPAAAYPVNVSPSTMIDGGYQSVVSCLNSDCLHQEFSDKSIEDYQ